MANIHIFVLLHCFIVLANSYVFQESLGHIKSYTNPEIQQNAAFDVIERIIPQRASEFSTEVNPNLQPINKDTFQIVKEGNIVRIVGTTGVAITSGFHYYLKYFCSAHISWEASQLNLPSILPDINITVSLNDKFRYYQNVCTTSYSFLWWNWEQWEKHIDWMALNSFNLVLAFTGQEAIWKRVYTKLNLTERNINDYFTGPAFLSWLRMGNIRKWGGPLSHSWHERSIILQKKILNRMRSLGMIPILPAFAGHLPKDFKRLYPNVNMTLTAQWSHFNDTYCCPYFLEPLEGLFKMIGKLFIQEQIREFGTDHVYSCDSFNEMDPVTSDLTYISNVGKSIYAAMTEADPHAVWVMQGWLFHSSMFFWTRERAKALLTSVPIGKMIVLDLQSEQFPQYERLEQYFGQPYIWCMLHNFGGTLGMFGSVNVINKNIFKARNQDNSTMVGIGVTPEGINQNYVIYDFMTEAAWRKEPSDLTEWFANYTTRRYGNYDERVVRAWQLLKDSIYDFNGIERIRGHYAITITPNLKYNVWTWYNYTDLYEALDLFIDAAGDFRNSSTFLHDLVDLTRQMLQINGDVYYTRLITAFNNKDYNEFQEVSRIFMNIFADLELILSTNTAFLLGPWLETAKACANDSKQEQLLEYNARNQITLWGPSGEIINYANKQWSGIVSHYFAPRWQIFINKMNESLLTNQKFNEKLVKQKMFVEVEELFTFDRSLFPTTPIGDTVQLAKEIHNRWHDYKCLFLSTLHRRTERSSEEKSDDNSPEVIVV